MKKLYDEIDEEKAQNDDVSSTSSLNEEEENELDNVPEVSNNLLRIMGVDPDVVENATPENIKLIKSVTKAIFEHRLY